MISRLRRWWRRRHERLHATATLSTERLVEGQVAELATTFTNKTGEPTNPHSVRYSFRSPSNAVTHNEAPTNPSTGVWAALLSLSAPNTWWYRCEGLNEAGETIAVSQGPIEVEKTVI